MTKSILLYLWQIIRPHILADLAPKPVQIKTGAVYIPTRSQAEWDESCANELKAFLAGRTGKTLIAILENTEVDAALAACRDELANREYRAGTVKGLENRRLHIQHLAAKDANARSGVVMASEDPTDEEIAKNLASRIRNGQRIGEFTL